MDNLVGLVAVFAVIVTTTIVVTVTLMKRDPVSALKSRSQPGDSTHSHDDAKLKIPTRGTLLPASADYEVRPGSPRALLESSSSPVVIAYFPLSDLAIRDFDFVPVNPTMQKAILDIIHASGTKGEVLYKVILPRGGELVNAIGQEGFRGFSRAGGKTAHAVLKPVVVGGAAAISWPVVAVTATMLILDSATQYQQRKHQRNVESILSRQESRYFDEQLAQQRAIDKRLTREVYQILEGNRVSLEESRTRANVMFIAAHQFLRETRSGIQQLGVVDGTVDFRKLDVALGGKSGDVEYFLKRLYLAQSAIALEKRAVVAYAASVALADPTNPFTKLHSVLLDEATEIERAEQASTELTEVLSQLQLKGNWLHKQRDKFLDSKWSVTSRQTKLREGLATFNGVPSNELQFTVSSSGELRQLVSKQSDQLNQES